MDKYKIIQNLKDAGCKQSFIDEFLKLEKCKQFDLLAKHKNNLLDNLHKNQRQIDCLDYLVFDLKQNSQKKI